MWEGAKGPTTHPRLNPSRPPSSWLPLPSSLVHSASTLVHGVPSPTRVDSVEVLLLLRCWSARRRRSIRDVNDYFLYFNMQLCWNKSTPISCCAAHRGVTIHDHLLIWDPWWLRQNYEFVLTFISAKGFNLLYLFFRKAQQTSPVGIIHKQSLSSASWNPNINNVRDKHRTCWGINVCWGTNITNNKWP